MPVASSSMPITIGVLNPSRLTTRGATTTISNKYHRGGHRQKRRAALEGAVAEHLLHVEVQEEPHRDPRSAEQHLGQVRGGQVGRAQEAEAH